jgi:hypothetical protein
MQMTALVAPSPFAGSAPFVGASTRPTTIGFTTVPAFACPLISPFASGFTLIIEQRSGSDLTLNRARFRFVDGTGLPSPVDLARSDLVGRFGSTIVPNGRTRGFDFDLQFGCGFASIPSSVVIDVFLLDSLGTTHQRTVTASIIG